ncbi:pilus (MSHA type) biogenesis protein MshL [Helicobacter sp. 11S02629-2]|uniref:pilus (MSHA type) biogenesis protein MshL n=1 Tax=Helicobacter sp. 11S02629-2 TaxID=1476195 RepID=UPI000BA6EE16|nr:pilus (MSHA type) biogenesis protein MshL [Helicobacter sp. 11S02629-2]PAF44117.1 hypothetical protein BKH40_05795 [Helicobacter sp. 11S02629-2]
MTSYLNNFLMKLFVYCFIIGLVDLSAKDATKQQQIEANIEAKEKIQKPKKDNSQQKNFTSSQDIANLKNLENTLNLTSPSQIDLKPTKTKKRLKSFPLGHNKIFEDEDIDIAKLAPACSTTLHTLTKPKEEKLSEILSALASECGFSVEYINWVENDTLALHLDKRPLKDILNISLRNYYYEVSPFLLRIYGLAFETFDINYIASVRTTLSNTSVTLSQEQNQNSYSTSYNYGTFQPNLATNPYTLNNAFEGSLSGNRPSSSGTKIYSMDELNFWDGLEKELSFLLKSSPPNVSTNNPQVAVNNSKFSIDKNAGLVSVLANKSHMRQVSQFLENMHTKMRAQIFLNVEILNITHTKSTNAGIDWNNLASIFSAPATSGSLNLGGNANGAFNLDYSLNILNPNVSLSSILGFLETQGNVKSLSNPRVSALNNQPAIISVGSVLRYSQNLIFQTSNTNNTIQNQSVQYPSVFVGILLDITPSISDDEIILRINPSITRAKNALIENSATALSSPPNLSTNQLSSIVRLKNGEKVIIGGLISNHNETNENGIIGLRRVKGIFSNTKKLNRSEEIVIIITPTIIE